jgi:putative colanic acid biosysnthesis UDP-glucose lipid carrier transferase
VRLGYLHLVQTGKINTPLALGETCPAEITVLTQQARRVNCSVIKRATDLILASSLILLLLPTLIVIAVAIKASSAGPILSPEQRYGAAGQVFWLLKFRTARVTETNGTIVQAGQTGTALTWIGYCLRCSSLEELPQLFNILQGTMSIVGPRVHVPAMQDYDSRHFVRPGLTGLTQLNGHLAPSKHLESISRDVA